MTDADSASPTFDASELALLESLGTRRFVQAGSYLYRAGDSSYDFYVVLSGQIEIIVPTDGEDRLLATHGPGRFLGELNLLTGLRVFVDARVAEDGEVLAVPVETLRRIISTQPQLSDKILAAFMARRAVLLTGAASTTRVIGSRFSPETLQIREYLARTRLPYEWLDPDADAQVDTILQQFHIQPDELPVAISSGAVLRRATPGAVAEHLGLTVSNLPERCFDLSLWAGDQPAWPPPSTAHQRVSTPLEWTWWPPEAKPGPVPASRTISGSRPESPEETSPSEVWSRPRSSGLPSAHLARRWRCGKSPVTS
jgi:thioredoxin reductase (NADPH)